jgi:hypothetical protein
MLMGGSPNFADTWELDVAGWREIPSGRPAPRYNAAMTYDAIRDRVVLFGGTANGSALGDTWEHDGMAWVRILTKQPPAAREGAAMVFDPSTRLVYLVGGNALGGVFADTWSFDGTTWSDITPAVHPSARTRAVMAYDTRRERVVLHGGGDFDDMFGDTWSFDGTTWTDLVQPVALRQGAGMSYDPVRDRIVMYGGSWPSGSAVIPQTTLREFDGFTWMNVPNDIDRRISAQRHRPANQRPTRVRRHQAPDRPRRRFSDGRTDR